MKEEKNSKKDNKKWVIVGMFCIALVASGILLVVTNNGIPLKTLTNNGLPTEKLNQGYDFVCGTSDHIRTCLFNETNRTVVNSSLKLGFMDIKTNKTKPVDLFAVDSKDKNYCLKIFDVDMKNQTKDCSNGLNFPKDTWTVSLTIDKKGNEGIIEFRNSTK